MTNSKIVISYKTKLKSLQVISIACSMFFLLANFVYNQLNSYTLQSILGIVSLIVGIIAIVFFFTSLVLLKKERKINKLLLINLLVVAYPLVVIIPLILIAIFLALTGARIPAH